MPSLGIGNNTFESIVQDFPVDIDSMARELGAFSRSRVIRDPKSLLRAVLLYCGLDQSLREVAANFTRNGCRLSDEAVRGRLRACQPWLRSMLAEMMPKPDSEDGRLVLVDSTSIQAPGAVTTDYRLHLGWNWGRERLCDLLVTDNRIGESLKLFDLRSGDMVLADAGYAKAPQLTALKQQGADYVVRCVPRQIRLYSPDGERLDVAQHLQKHEGRTTVSVSVMIEAATDRQVAWLHAYRLPNEAAELARRRARKRAQKKYHGVLKSEILYLADWMILLTSLPPERMSADDVGKLYRGRWQIEIVIKRLKSVLHLNALRARRGSQLAQVYLLGKILYALLIEKRALSFKKARDIEWRTWKIIADQIRGCITLWRHDQKLGDDVLHILKERSRKRKRLRDNISALFPAKSLTRYVSCP